MVSFSSVTLKINMQYFNSYRDIQIISSWLSLESLWFSKDLFLLSCWIYEHTFIHSFPYYSFNDCRTCGNIPYDTGDLCISHSRVFSILLIFLEETTLVWLVCHWFPIFITLISALYYCLYCICSGFILLSFFYFIWVLT